jgi:uncharacterized protein
MVTTTSTDADQHEDHDRARDRRPMTAGRAFLTMVIALGVAALLGAPSVERAAEHQGYGRGRDLLLDVARPASSLSHALFLDRPREWLASWTGHEDGPSGTTFGSAVSAPSATTAPSTTATTPASIDPATTTTIATTTTEPPRRTPTADAPLRVWMGGDSLMGAISDDAQIAVNGDPRYAFSTDVQVGTGLARPDVLDWAAELQAQMDATNPDVVVLSFGGNDDQPLHGPNGEYYSLFTPEWQAEYARRIGLMMDVASASGARTVVWLGLPSERPENLDGAKEAVNAAAQAEAAKRPHVVYVPLGPLVAGPDGGYADDLTLADGSTIRARREDGVHLTNEGAALVVPAILDAFAKEWNLR